MRNTDEKERKRGLINPTALPPIDTYHTKTDQIGHKQYFTDYMTKGTDGVMGANQDEGSLPLKRKLMADHKAIKNGDLGQLDKLKQIGNDNQITDQMLVSSTEYVPPFKNDKFMLEIDNGEMDGEELAFRMQVRAE